MASSMVALAKAAIEKAKPMAKAEDTARASILDMAKGRLQGRV